MKRRIPGPAPDRLQHELDHAQLGPVEPIGLSIHETQVPAVIRSLQVHERILQRLLFGKTTLTQEWVIERVHD